MNTGQVARYDGNHEKQIRRKIRLDESAFGRHSELINTGLAPSLRIKPFNQ